MHSKSHAKIWASGRKHHQTFLVRLEDDEISVDRLGQATDSTMAQIQQQVAALRSASGFYGWAVLSVEKAARSGRTVRPDPIYQLGFNNEWHAVIELHLTDEGERRDQQKAHATELTAAATWKQWPTNTAKP